jgi:hypothetical protein
MKSILVFLVLLWSGAAAAQSPPAVTTREIAHLFSALEQSNCQFYRNGSWYTQAKASAHLRRKYDYLLKAGLVKSTESFIDLAASKSSMSGRPYLVKCGDSAPVESNTWFRASWLRSVMLLRALTIHSSRSRFAARLNSGVRPHTCIENGLSLA